MLIKEDVLNLQKTKTYTKTFELEITLILQQKMFKVHFNRFDLRTRPRHNILVGLFS